MGISTELATRFAKSTIDKSKPNTGKTVNGTAVAYGGKIFVRIDGSDQLTPIISSTAGMKDGDRVTVLIKDHTATVTGNTSSPSAGQGDIDESHQDIIDQITEVEILVAEKASIKDLEAESARIDNLVADNVIIKDKLTANEADIKNLKAENVEISGNLNAQNAEIENLKATKLDVEIADIKYATVENLEATNANIHNLEADYGSFKDLATDKFTATDAEIKRLDAEKVSAEELDAKYANIDFANIGKAAIENFFSKSGMIGDLVVGEGTVTGTLVGVTIKGDLIEGGTVKADKLVIKGEDGLYYKLNTNGETVGAEQTDYNSLNGSIITAKSITAEKVNVNDLVAFGATIGGFHITDSSLYSGVKESIDNTTRGTFMDDQGQFAIGDQTNYLKFFRDSDGKYKLDISAASIKMGASSIDEVIKDSVDNAVGDIRIGGRNLIYSSIFSDLNTREFTGSYWANVLIKPEDVIKIIEPSTQYTISFEAELAGISENSDDKMHSSKVGFMFLSKTTAPSTSIEFVSYDIDQSSVVGTKISYSKTFTTPAEIPSDYSLLAYTRLWESGTSNTDTVKFTNLKLEQGSIATDWTPAPEDMATTEQVNNAQSSADDANGKADSTAGRLEKAESSIEILDKSISSLVTDANGTSLMTQTPDGWTFNIGGIQSSLNNATNDLNNIHGDLNEAKDVINKTNDLINDISEKTAYIVMTTDDTGNPCIELGKENNPFKVRITNTSVDFMESNIRIAYISNRALYIERAVIKNELQIGEGQGFVWKKRENGNMGLRWIEVNN